MTIDATTIKNYSDQFEVPQADVLRIAVEEGFLRRAALVNGPFMLKGSYVSRQLLAEGWRRIPGDLDWVGLGALDARELTQWVTSVTEAKVDDGIRFRSFSENVFWRMIEYAMDDDFPTVNTDLLAWVGEQSFEISSMDVSFGLKLQPAPGPLAYVPQFGEPFVLPLSCPLELQIAWKLHQCLVRPRFKDMLDLTLLLRENTVDAAVIWNALEDECRHDATPIARFNWLLDGTIGQHANWRTMQRERSPAQLFSLWRNPGKEHGENYWGELALPQIYVGDIAVANTFADFLAGLAEQLKRAGFAHVTPGPSGVKGVLARWIGRQ